MSARFKGRRKQAQFVVDSATGWARNQVDVAALALVGSYAYGRPRMGSDLDIVLLTSNPDRHASGITWAAHIDPGARLIRDQVWGPLRERRVRLQCGLHVELGVVPLAWAALPLDPGTARVLRDGCKILHDPDGILREALATLP